MGSGEMVFLITSDVLGQEKELGEILMKSFLSTLEKSERKPRRMLFLNTAVFLTTEGSEVQESLVALEEAGVEIMSCGTCLDYFNLKDKLKVGKAGTMAATVESLTSGAAIVKI